MGILQHTLGILVRPASEWKLIRSANRSFLQVFIGQVPFLALIPSISAYIGVTQVGWSVGDGDPIKLTSASAASLCALAYAVLLVAIYVLGEFVNWMSKTYGVQGDDSARRYRAMALAVYVSTPILIAGLANLYPEMWFVIAVMGVAGVYAVFLIYQGIPIVMSISREQAFMYANSVVTVALVLMVTVLMATVVLWGLGIGPVYID